MVSARDGLGRTCGGAQSAQLAQNLYPCIPPFNLDTSMKRCVCIVIIITYEIIFDITPWCPNICAVLMYITETRSALRRYTRARSQTLALLTLFFLTQSVKNFYDLCKSKRYPRRTE